MVMEVMMVVTMMMVVMMMVVTMKMEVMTVVVLRKVKFAYGPLELPLMVAGQMDGSMRRFMERFDIAADKDEADVLADASEIVHNNKDKAVRPPCLVQVKETSKHLCLEIMAEAMVAQNEGRLPDWAVRIKLLNAFKSVAVLPAPANSSFTSSDGESAVALGDLMAFIDEKSLVISELSDEDWADMEATLWKRFRDRVSLVQLPTHYTPDAWRNRTGVCGLFTSLVSTQR